MILVFDCDPCALAKIFPSMDQNLLMCLAYFQADKFVCQFLISGCEVFRHRHIRQVESDGVHFSFNLIGENLIIICQLLKMLGFPNG